MSKIDQNVTGDGNQIIGQVQGGLHVQGDAIDNSQTIHHHHAAAPPPKERPRGEKILLKTVRSEVRDRLDQSLHNALFINLPKESQPEQVERPWDFEVKVGDRDSQALPSEQTIVDVFDDEEIDNKLLILGHPGSGKTTSLLDLAQTLVVRAEKSAEVAIPVLFNLSSWAEDKQPIADWLRQELKSKYGVSQKLGQRWLDQHRLMLLLDGLDELAPGRQELCIQRLNQWLTSGTGRGGLVVCSRVEEYESCETELALWGAVCLQPFNDQQIEQYLREVGKPALQAAVANNAELREMMRVPLHISMAVLVYNQEFGKQWQQLKTGEEQLSLLLSAYVEHMLNREIPSLQLIKVGYDRQNLPSILKTQKYLQKLSKELKKASRDEFLIEKIEDDWITGFGHKFAIFIVESLLTFPIFFLTLSLFWDHGLIGAILVIPILRFASLKNRSFNFLLNSIRSHLSIGQISERFTLGLRKARSELKIRRALLIGLVAGGFSALLFGGTLLVGGVIAEGLYMILLGLIVGPLIGGFLVLFSWLYNSISAAFFGLPQEDKDSLMQEEVEISNRPNEKNLKMRNRLLVTMPITAALLAVLRFSVRPVLYGWLNIEEIVAGSLLSTILKCFLLILMYALGWDICCKHLALRLVLYFSGQAPWNYARFLNYCTARLLIQRVGGRYRFIHKRLLEHFAAMPLES